MSDMTTKVSRSLAAALLLAALSTQAAIPPALPATNRPADRADIPLAGANAAAVTVPSAANAWGGPRTGTETTLSDRVVDYRIRATLDPVTHRIDGQERLGWRNRSDRPVRAVYLHLYLNAFEGSGRNGS